MQFRLEKLEPFDMGKQNQNPPTTILSEKSDHTQKIDL
jgi:hypothetical protein